MENQARQIEENFDELGNSFKLDYQLFRAEIQVNAAHCEALFQAGILTRLEAERIKNGLQTIIKRAEYDKNYFNEFGSKDIHSFVAARIVQLVGEAGKKIRIGRSEIEHRLTTLRLWLRFEIEEIIALIKECQVRLIFAGENQKTAIFPAIVGFQKKQPVLWTHWCLAHFEMLQRDKERLDEVWRRVNVSPFGAETSFEIDREEIAAALKFEGVSMNSLDAVSDSDFAIEFCTACSILTLHLSRLAEEIIIYLSKEFGLLEFKDKNQLVQEKNLNYLQMLRTKASETLGHQITLLTANKNFTIIADNDFRGEKEALFSTVETVRFSLKTAALLIKNIFAVESKTLDSSVGSYLRTEEITNYLLKKDTSLEAAKDAAHKIFEYATEKNKQISELNLADLQKFSSNIEADVYEALKIEEILASKNQIGGSAPERVFEALDTAKKSLEREEIQSSN